MEGRYPNGLLFVVANCSDPTKEEEFNYWYNHIHLPDATEPGVFIHAIRFESTDPNPGMGKYVCTYETYQPDVAKAWEQQLSFAAKWRGTDRFSHYMDLSFAGAFKRVGGEFRASIRPTRGIMAVMFNCNDSEREEELNQWYGDVHIPDILDSGLWHTAYRYESTNPAETKAKYLTIYETDSSNPYKQTLELEKLRADWAQRGRSTEIAVERVYRASSRRIWPME